MRLPTLAVPRRNAFFGSGIFPSQGVRTIKQTAVQPHAHCPHCDRPTVQVETELTGMWRLLDFRTPRVQWWCATCTQRVPTPSDVLRPFNHAATFR